MKKSIHSYAWIKVWAADAVELVAPKAAAKGFNHVVIPMRDHTTINPAEIDRVFSAHDITPVVTATQTLDADISSLDPEIRRRGLDRHRASLKLARDMGAYHMGGIIYGVFGKAEAAATDENRKVAAEALATLAEDAKPMGLRLAMEILNRYETNMFNTVDEAIAFVKMSGSDNLFLHLDTFHMNMEETDMLAALKRALPYLVYFEMDQNDRGLLDRGAIDFHPMLQVLKDSGYNEIIGAEAFSSAVSGPDVARGVSAWRPLFTHGDEVADSANAVLGSVYPL
ncbi:sugar phosphate isomerase/epimerase family protein [Neorhizobium alkalisoli]|uniref:D-psicose/D-tagatose/L-ribulose 3-epimerase n=1 Tax=Neorhizobium alkalisoli TaxID=528178 RepID=A0A561R9H3_9HYPH|nr:sugar phosphate isomerase/epimerase family protein [Neorhizobium alkalisoli]TWF59253.1 D-psicose/D-tagatose/L-ribulose 3-epimerase [Neorhizobium alkalisoli]